VLGWAVSLFCATPPFRGKQRLFRALFSALPYRAARSRYGVRMTRNLRDATYRFCMLGSYGRFIERLLSDRSSPFAFVDIGANQGIFTLIAARNPACRKVVAFEPNPRTFALLIENIALNAAGDNVTPICAAIALEGQDILRFSVPDAHSGAASLFGRGERHFEALRIHEGALRALLDGLDGVPIVMKVDVEGAELIVLKALEEAGLLSRVGELVLEVSDVAGGGNHAQPLLDFLNQAGWAEASRSGEGTHYDAVFRRTAV
jgi:FkbM family methyltransferase